MAPDRAPRRGTALAIGLLCVAGVAALVWSHRPVGADAELVGRLRLVRGLTAVLLGACLSISGALLQGVMKNDLVEPGILGVNAGGNLAAMIAMLALPEIALVSPGTLAFVAWSGAAGTCLLVLLLGSGPGGYRPTQLLLTGVGVGAAVSALSVPIAMLAPVEALFFQAVYRREIGALQAGDLGSVAVLVPFLATLGPAAWLLGRSVDTLALGEDAARSLGLRLGRTRVLTLLVAAGLSGACVAVGGGMAFVGLLGPHIGRRLVGPTLRRLVPAAAAVGGLLVLAADQLGQHLLPLSEVPAGLLVAVIGAPYLLYLLMR
ncbi:MAG: iron ABC transporter permease [Myxococcales bacterium]|nr:iron ABC transporter permease [Myxococcales bacterium]